MDGKGDVRIKKCIKPTEEELYTIYHELGHIYYYLRYMEQPYLFQDGAHDGFHEAIGDTINLSMTEGTSRASACSRRARSRAARRSSTGR